MFTQTLSNNFPGFCVWEKDVNSAFTNMNAEFAAMLGFKTVADAIGKLDYDIPSRFANCADIFRENDQKVMSSKQTLRFLEIQCDANKEWHVLFVVKSPKFSGTNVTGTCGYLTDITQAIHKVNFLLGSEKGLFDISLSLDNNALNINLNKRESECLFFLLRGKTAKQIASILQLSPRTIEAYIDKIKHKFNCSSKTELISLATDKGFISFIPTMLLNTEFSVEL